MSPTHPSIYFLLQGWWSFSNDWSDICTPVHPSVTRESRCELYLDSLFNINAPPLSSAVSLAPSGQSDVVTFGLGLSSASSVPSWRPGLCQGGNGSYSVVPFRPVLGQQKCSVGSSDGATAQSFSTAQSSHYFTPSWKIQQKSWLLTDNRSIDQWVDELNYFLWRRITDSERGEPVYLVARLLWGGSIPSRSWVNLCHDFLLLQKEYQ